MASEKQIIVELVGAERDGERVRLNDFLEQLGAIRDALRETERLVMGGAPTLYFRIAGLSYNSPAKVILEAASDSQPPEYTAKVVNQFAANLRFLTSNKRAPRRHVDVPVLKAYKEMAAPLNRDLTGLVVSTGGRHKIAINRDFRGVIEKAMGPDQVMHGSVSGKLEAINLHQTTKFVIYPVMGPSRVAGKFRVRLRKQFAAAVDKYVTVYGELRYKTWDKFPHSVVAEDIVIHPDNPQRLTDLWGMAPGATGDLSTEDYIDHIRDGWKA